MMSRQHSLAAVCMTLALSAATSVWGQELACTRIGYSPGTPDPNRCFVVASPTADPLSAARAYADQGNARTLKQAQAHADAGDARTLEAATRHAADGLASLDKRLSAGIAQAAAVVPLDPQTSGQTTLNLGAASYAGQTAVGIAVAHRAGPATFAAGVSGTSSSKRALVRVSAGWRF